MIQINYYIVFDSMGRKTGITIAASNIKEAHEQAKKMVKEIGTKYYKLKRSFQTGVKSQTL